MNIVVDASIGRSAGGNRAIAAISIIATHCLESIETSRLTIIFTDELWTEWNNNHSSFSWDWLTKMNNTGRVTYLENYKNDGLRNFIGTLMQNQKKVLEKDTHLIEAALASDRRIISFDRKVLGKLPLLLSVLPDISTLYWCNPVLDENSAIQWLKNECPDRVEYHCITLPSFILTQSA